MNETNEIEIKEENNFTKLDVPENKNKIEKNFYAEKMKNITEGGIYNLVKELCKKFCRGKEYTINIWNEKDFNEDKQQKHESFQKEYESMYQELANKPNVFVPPNFSGPEPKKSGFLNTLFYNDKKTDPFIFFEKVDPNKFSNKFSEEVKNNPEAIANYVKQFANYLSELFQDSDFAYFLISSEENRDKLKQIIGSDFVLKGDEENPELFKESHLLDVGTSLFGKYSYCQCYDNETETTHANEKKLKSLISDYLNKTFAISNEALRTLLFKNDFYKIFADTENMNEIIIDAIKKTDFHSYTSGASYASITGLNSLLKEGEEKNELGKIEDCFYDKNRDGINNALADKCAEIFADTKESVEINLKTLTERYESPYVCNFMSDYLSNKENKNSETGKKLIEGLKKWLDNNDLLLWEYSSELDKYIENKKLGLFLYDDDLKKSFANACARTIKYFIDKKRNEYNWNLAQCQEYLDDIKTGQKQFLDKFGITLGNYDCSQESYETHGKNIAWLSLWIFLFLLCIAAMIEIYIVIPIPILKNMCFLMVIPMFPITSKGTDRVTRIIRDRVYNAKLDIYKSKTKMEAQNKLSWGMLRFSEVKNCFDLKFHNSEDKNNERNNNLIDD